jgi:hypothetical protein
MRHPVLVVTTTREQFVSVNLEIAFDKVVIFLSETSLTNKHKIVETNEVSPYLNSIAKQHEITHVGIISKTDRFNPHEIKKEINCLIHSGAHKNISLLVPYLKPPLYESRNDGAVQSGLFDFWIFEKIATKKKPFIFSVFIFSMLMNISNNEIINKRFKIFQVGRSTARVLDQDMILEQLHNAKLIIPQTQSVSLTHATLLSYLKSEITNPDETPRKARGEFLSNLQVSDIQKRNPAPNDRLNTQSDKNGFHNLNHMIRKTRKNLLYFQNFDDVSLSDRFIAQLKEMEERKLDMVGSHILQVESLKQRLVIVRFPLEIRKEFLAHYLDAVHVPAMLISKQAFLKSGGFSTTKEIDCNAQYLFRCLLKLNVGNADDFLYLSMSKGSADLNEVSDLEKKSKFYKWRWQVDYKLINQGKLNLKDSSLQLMR